MATYAEQWSTWPARWPARSGPSRPPVWGTGPAPRSAAFFDALPAGAGGYVLSGVIHDWDDEDARRILKWCADAASETGKVLLADHIADGQGGTPDTEGDLRMLCYVRGRERTLDQLAELAGSAGLRFSSIASAGARSIAEFRPSH